MRANVDGRAPKRKVQARMNSIKNALNKNMWKLQECVLGTQTNEEKLC